MLLSLDYQSVFSQTTPNMCFYPNPTIILFSLFPFRYHQWTACRTCLNIGCVHFANLEAMWLIPSRRRNVVKHATYSCPTFTPSSTSDHYMSWGQHDLKLHSRSLQPYQSISTSGMEYMWILALPTRRVSRFICAVLRSCVGSIGKIVPGI